MPTYLINTIPDIQSRSYLELGIFDGHHFDTVNTQEKTSVDLANPAHYRMSTDVFFTKIPANQKWDVIYIDADHSCKSILKDFNNAIKHLSPGGTVFLHDLHPENETLTQPQYCGTGYQFLDLLRRNQYPNVYTQNSDYGITIIFEPKTTLSMSSLQTKLKYNEFIARWKDSSYQLYTIAGMQAAIQEHYHG